MKFWNTLRVNRNAPLYMLAFQAGFFAFGVLIVVIINIFFNEEKDYACIGSMMAAMGIAAGIVARGGTSAARFRLAVMMGQSRRSFLLWDTLCTVATAAVGYGACWVLCQAELALYGALYPGYENMMSMNWLFVWPMPPAAILAVCVLDLAMGALYVRFGSKAFMVVWITLCLMPMVVGQSVGRSRGGQMTLLARLGTAILAVAGALTPEQWILVGIAALLAVGGLSVRGYWDAEVRV